MADEDRELIRIYRQHLIARGLDIVLFGRVAVQATLTQLASASIPRPT